MSDFEKKVKKLKELDDRITAEEKTAAFTFRAKSTTGTPS